MIAQETCTEAASTPLGAAAGLRILSLSCVYPNPGEPRLGVFVESRLKRLARLAEVKVLAPVPQIDFAKGSRLRSRRKVPFRRWGEGMEVFHPSWIYPPGGNAVNPYFLFLRLWPLALRIRKSFAYDLIDAHFAFPEGIAGGLLEKALGVPFAVTLRGSELLHAKYPKRKRLMARALCEASAVIALSDELKQFALSMGASAERVKLIPNGLESRIFYLRDRAQSRGKHGIPAEAKIVLSAGSLIELKGHHRAAKAVASLRDRGINVDLLIAGGAGRAAVYEGEIRAQAADLGLKEHIRFLGEVSQTELAELMSAADVLCLASSREGWPNVVLEAMACGLPVVATRVGAVADMIPSPDYGLVVPPGDAAELARSLGEALEKTWDRATISRWAHSHTWEQTAREAFDFLRRQITPTEERLIP